MKAEIFSLEDPHAFYARLYQEYIKSAKSKRGLQNSVVLGYLRLGGRIVANGLESIYYQTYEYPQLNRLINFLKQIGCDELARRIERGRDIYYRGRTDLLTFDDLHAAGLDGNHLTEEEWAEMEELVEGMYGSDDSLLGLADKLFMNYVKAHPELLDELE